MTTIGSLRKPIDTAWLEISQILLLLDLASSRDAGRRPVSRLQPQPRPTSSGTAGRSDSCYQWIDGLPSCNQRPIYFLRWINLIFFSRCPRRALCCCRRPSRLRRILSHLLCGSCRICSAFRYRPQLYPYPTTRRSWICWLHTYMQSGKLIVICCK